MSSKPLNSESPCLMIDTCTPKRLAQITKGDKLSREGRITSKEKTWHERSASVWNG